MSEVQTIGAVAGEMAGFTVHEQSKATMEDLQRYQAAIRGNEHLGAAVADWLLCEHMVVSGRIGMFGLGASEKGDVRYVMIPYFADGELVNIAAVSTNAKKPIRAYRSQNLQPFNIDQVIQGAKPKRVVVMPTEFDVMALTETLDLPLISFPVEEKQALRPEWVEHFEGVEEIVFVVSARAAETRIMMERARQLGLKRVKLAVLPDGVTTATKLVLQAGKVALEHLVRLAKDYAIPQVSQMKDAIGLLADQLSFPDEDRVQGLARMGFDNVDRILGPIQPGNLIVVIADAKTGKTSYVLQALTEWALARGTPGFFGIAESEREELAEKAIQFSFGVPAPITDPVILQEAQIHFRSAPLYVSKVSGYSYREIQKLLDFYYDLIKTYALRIVVFDHLHSLIRGSRNPEGDTAMVSWALKEFALKMRVGFILLVQPNRGDDDRTTTIRHARNTGLIEADCDKWLSLNRRLLKDGKVESDGTVIGLRAPLTQVMAGGRATKGGSALLMFEEEISRFRKLTEAELAEVTAARERAENAHGGRGQRG